MTTSTGFIRFRDSQKNVPVAKIICLGRNYESHAREMGSEPPERPILFLKPPSAIIHDGESVILPQFSRELHHEVEMVVAIGKRGKEITVAAASGYISGFGVGLDMTLRDLQSEAKKKGLPWSVAKGFDTSAPVSEFVNAREVGDPGNLGIQLAVNGQLRQSSNTRKMIFSVQEIIAFVSSTFTLEEGDLIFTGTPEGVGRVDPGDVMEASLESVAQLRVTVGR